MSQWAPVLFIICGSACAPPQMGIGCSGGFESVETIRGTPESFVIPAMLVFRYPVLESEHLTTVTISTARDRYQFQRPAVSQASEFCLAGGLLGGWGNAEFTAPFEKEELRFRFEGEGSAWIEQERDGDEVAVDAGKLTPWNELSPQLLAFAQQAFDSAVAESDPTAALRLSDSSPIGVAASLQLRANPVVMSISGIFLMDIQVGWSEPTEARSTVPGLWADIKRKDNR